MGDDAEDGVEGFKDEDDAHAEAAEENGAVGAVEEGEGGDCEAGPAVAGGGAGVVFSLGLRGVGGWGLSGGGGIFVGEGFEDHSCDRH